MTTGTYNNDNSFRFTEKIFNIIENQDVNKKFFEKYFAHCEFVSIFAMFNKIYVVRLEALPHYGRAFIMLAS